MEGNFGVSTELIRNRKEEGRGRETKFGELKDAQCHQIVIFFSPSGYLSRPHLHHRVLYTN
jgi:hypothetical protein